MNQAHPNLPPLLRLKQLLTIVPVSRSAWWAGVKSGRFPQPMKLGPRTTVWRTEDLMPLLQNGWDKDRA